MHVFCILSAAKRSFLTPTFIFQRILPSGFALVEADELISEADELNLVSFLSSLLCFTRETVSEAVCFF